MQWDAPAACPSAAQGLSRIEANLGAPLNTIETDTRFAVTLFASDRGWSARIDSRSGTTNSSRTLRAVDDCDEASAAAALVVAIALDPTAAATPPAERRDPSAKDPEPAPPLIPEPEPLPEEPLPAEPRPEEPRPEEPLPEDPRPEPEQPRPPRGPVTAQEPLVFGGHLGVAAGLRYGSLDRVLGVLDVRGGLVLPRARVSLEAVIAPRRAVAIDDAAQVRFTQWGVAAGGCWRVPLVATLVLEPCGALELGQTRSSTRGLDNATTQAPIWVALRAGPHLTWRFSQRTGLWAGVEALAPLTRSTYEVGGAGTVARVLRAGLHAFAGVEIRFGNVP